MKIYNVLINDRQCDPIVHNFRWRIAAYDFARQNAREFCNFPEDLKEIHYNPKYNNGWIMLIETSCEGDYVRISEGELK